MTIISDAIDEVSGQITKLHKQIRNSTYPERGQFMAEVKDLMRERGRLREMVDIARLAEP